MLKNCHRSLLDPVLEHARPFADQIHGYEIPAEECQKLLHVRFDAHFRLSVALDGDEGVEAAEHHHFQRVVVQIAEVEPVGPLRVKGAVEASDFRDGMDFPVVLLVALDAEDEGIHHEAQPSPGRQVFRGELSQKVREVSTLDFGSAELVNDQLSFSHGVIVPPPSGRHHQKQRDSPAIRI